MKSIPFDISELKLKIPFRVKARALQWDGRYNFQSALLFYGNLFSGSTNSPCEYYTYSEQSLAVHSKIFGMKYSQAGVYFNLNYANLQSLEFSCMGVCCVGDRLRWHLGCICVKKSFSYGTEQWPSPFGFK